MKHSLALTPVIVLAITETSDAANFAALAQPPTVLNLAVLVVASACFVFCMQVASLVRGGYLSRSWRLFMVGFAVLSLAQVGRLLSDLEVLTVPSWLLPMAWVVMACLFLYGLLETKRSLS